CRWHAGKEGEVAPETGRDDARLDPCKHAAGANGGLLLRLLGLRSCCRLLLLVYVGRRNRRRELGRIRPMTNHVCPTMTECCRFVLHLFLLRPMIRAGR